MKTTVIAILLCICYNDVANAQQREASKSYKSVDLSQIKDKEKKKDWYNNYVKPLDEERRFLDSELKKEREKSKKADDEIKKLNRIIQAYKFILRTDSTIYNEYKASKYQGIEVDAQLQLIGDVQKLRDILKRLDDKKNQIDHEFTRSKDNRLKKNQYKEQLMSDIEEASKLLIRIDKI
ncbi:MAG: hypothetical protein SOZ06_03295, partial [Candidatus Faecenecus gallistercoris]|nr:hypothetical protein [Candidatus Faecenecus gallistercoris]